MVEINRKKKDTGGYYAVIELVNNVAVNDFEDCFKVICTNKRSVSAATGIGYHRIVYIFVKKKKTSIVEKGHLIIKFTTLYKGSQKGNISPKLYQRGNDY